MKTSFSLLIVLIGINLTSAQDKTDTIDYIKSGKTETLDIGGLYDVALSYEFTINNNSFSLDTVTVDEDQIFGYQIENIDFIKNKLSGTEYTYQLMFSLQKSYLGQIWFADHLSFDGILHLEGDSPENITVVHEVTQREKMMPIVIFMQYFFRMHEWLLILSIIILLIRKTPLNLRHGLIVVFPLIGPLVYLGKELYGIFKRRRENKRKAQSTPHLQNAKHALES